MTIDDLQLHCKDKIMHTKDVSVVIEHQLILEVIKENEKLKMEVNSLNEHINIFQHEIEDLNTRIDKLKSEKVIIKK